MTILIGCAGTEVREALELPEEDFCVAIHRNDSINLTDQLAPYTDQIASKTGVYVLEEGDDSMVARAWLSEYAEQTIDIQYFIFSTDNIGLIASDYLLRAADRGVKVRILVDDIMVDAAVEDLLVLDAHENLSIRIYNPNINIGKNLSSKLYSVVTDFKGINQRMHNKTFTVDGKAVITGGRNIADEYFDYDHEYNFRDRDVLLLGKTVEKIQHSFNDFWSDSLAVPLSVVCNPSEYKLSIDTTYEWLHQYACNPENFWPQVREKINQVPEAFKSIVASDRFQWVDTVLYVSDDPGKNKSDGMWGGGRTTSVLLDLVNKAKKSISIQSPYLVTTELSQKLFREAIDRDVEVKILTNSLASTDNLEAFNGYMRDRVELVESGIRVFEFKPDAQVRYDVMTGALQDSIDFTPIFGLHAKSMVIDNHISVIGTFNLDPRSANLNTECIVIIYSDQVATDLYAAMEVDFRPENAWEITTEFNPDSEASIAKQKKVKSREVVPKSIL